MLGMRSEAHATAHRAAACACGPPGAPIAPRAAVRPMHRRSAAPQVRPRRLVVVAGERQTGNVATKRRLSGPPGLPPINGDDGGGGGGGGDGWGWERTARNVLPNLVFLGMYFMVTSYGGDGWGNFGGGGGGDGGGGGGGGGDGHHGQPGDGGGQPADAASPDDDRGSRAAAAAGSDDDDDAAPAYSYRRSSARSHYR